MNQSDRPCNPELIRCLLSGAIESADEQRLTDHLDQCATCRESLVDQSAAPEEWTQVSAILKEDPFDAESDGSLDLQDTACVETDRLPASIQQTLQSLGPTDDPEMLGRIGVYEISGVVGAGGMGVVLKAVDPSLERTVAIKVLTPHLATSGSARHRFAREAKAAAAVLHPNVIAIHGVSEGEPPTMLPYLVMPYVRGCSLQTRIDQQGPLSVTETLRVATQIVDGLAAAHAQGLVHRDIKPGNILLEDGIERVAITDFGLARAVDDASLTRSGVIAGTPQYMSPEQARGDNIDARSDLFSLGSVIYAMCTGRAPFRAESSYGILRRITDDDPRPMREINPDTPAWLERLVRRLHEKTSENRYQSAKQVAKVLHQCLAHLHTPSEPLPSELATPKTRSRSWIVGVVGCAALLASLMVMEGPWGLFTTTPSPHFEISSPPAADRSPLSPSDSPERSSERAAESEPLPADRTSWADHAEPSLPTVRQLIDSIDLQTHRSFDRSPESSTSPRRFSSQSVIRSNTTPTPEN